MKTILFLYFTLLNFTVNSQTLQWIDSINYTKAVSVVGLSFEGNNLVAFGSFANTVNQQSYGCMFKHKYNAQGIKVLVDTLHRERLTVKESAQDQAGNYYILARHEQDSGITMFGSQQLHGKKNYLYILIKYAVNHQVLWVKRLTNGLVFTIKYNKYDNNLYITGKKSAYGDTLFFDNHFTDLGGFIAKYDLNGNCLWAKKVNEGSVTFIDVDQFNNIYAVTSNTGSSYYYLTKYDQQCNTQWNYYVGSSMKKIATDSTGNCYITGSRYANSGVVQDNYFLDKISPNGMLEWSIKSNFGGVGDAIYINDSGYIYTGGSYGVANNHPDGLAIAKYNSSGTEIWHFQLPDAIPSINNEACEITAKDGAVYVGGKLNQQHPKSIVFKLHEPGVTTAIHEPNHLSGFSIYPNPGGSEFTLHYKNEKSKDPLFIYVRSITGQLVYTQTIPYFNGELREVINIGSQAKGNYFIEVRQGEAVEVRKLVVQ